MTGLTKIYIVIGGIVLLALSFAAYFVYSKGYTDGERNQQIEYATAKPNVIIERDTILVEKPVFRDRKVPYFVKDPRIDRLIASNADKDSLIRSLSENASATFESPELGRLEVDYVPLDRYFEIDHQPPPAKIERVTVTIEKPVLVRETFWQKVDEYLIAGAIGGAIVWIVD